MLRRILRMTFTGVLLLGLSGEIRPASLTLSPVRIELSAARPYAVLRITNSAAEPVTLHARAFRWSFDEHDDVLTTTDDLILNPPMATLPPKGVQVVRIGLRTPNQTTGELTYRVIVEEVPAQKREAVGSEISIILKLSIPVFAAPRQGATPRLEWSARHTDTGQLVVEAVNRGLAHIQIRKLLISSSEDRTRSEKFEGAVYLLPSQRRQWTLKEIHSGSVRNLVVEALTDAPNMRQKFTLDLN
jgi:fimbrial chaperone protein